LLLTCIWGLAAAVVVPALGVYFSVQRSALLSEIAARCPAR
jgi:hypothetical protein